MSSPSFQPSLNWPRSAPAPANPRQATLEVADRSYSQILNSSLLIGGSSAVTIVAAVLRTKIVAVFLGPAGVGLMGIFSSITSSVVTLSGMGISTSSVREIAEARGVGDTLRAARTTVALRRTVLWLGVLGSALLALLSVPISRLTFGSADHARDITFLSAAIAAAAIGEGQLARLQGFRRMGDLAKAPVLGALLTLALTLPVVYVWRQRSVVALLLVAAGSTMASSWWFARRVRVAAVSMTWRETLRGARPLVRLGLASMSSALLLAANGYIVRLLIARDLGIGAAGIFQSATALSSVYCGFILSAMGADFLPRLSAVAGDDATCNRLINEQVEVGLLLAFPGICATLAYSPLIIRVFYSPDFAGAADVLRWQVLGVLLRVASWPMGYLLIAKGKARLYFWTELSYNILYAGLIWISLRLWGLPGAGVAFFGLYIYYWLLMCVVTRRLSGFALTSANKRISSVVIPAVAIVFLGGALFPAPWDFVSASAVTVLAGLYSLRSLLSLPGNQGFPLLKTFGLRTGHD